MDLLRHSPEDDGTNPMPDEFRKWSKNELIAEVEELNRQVAYWVGVATERRGAVEALRLIADPPMGDDYTAPREYAEWLRDQARRALANLGGQ
jgi:hypothetical protein